MYLYHNIDCISHTKRYIAINFFHQTDGFAFNSKEDIIQIEST